MVNLTKFGSLKLDKPSYSNEFPKFAFKTRKKRKTNKTLNAMYT